jgi:recombination protein RecA
MPNSKDLDKKINKILSDRALKKLRENNMIMKGEDEVNEGDIKPLRTRFCSLNLMIGIGGLPKGKIVEISGAEGGFKSALCWAVAGDTQRQGGVVAWIDAENAIDLRIPKVRKFLESLRVDYNKILIIRVNTAEQAFKAIQILAQNGNVSLIVFDSIVALSNNREDTEDIEKQDRNTLSMTINRGLRKCAKLLRRTECTLILINQLRVNQDRKGPFDKKWQTTGGKGLKHWCSLRLEAYSQKLKDNDGMQVGSLVTYSVIKTRFDVPRDKAKLFYYFNKGFDIYEELVELAITWGVLDKSQKKKSKLAWTDHEDEFEPMTRKEWINFLKTDKKSYKKMLAEISVIYEDYYETDNEAEEDVEEEVDEDDAD